MTNVILHLLYNYVNKHCFCNLNTVNTSVIRRPNYKFIETKE